MPWQEEEPSDRSFVGSLSWTIASLRTEILTQFILNDYTCFDMVESALSARKPDERLFAFRLSEFYLRFSNEGGGHTQHPFSKPPGVQPIPSSFQRLGYDIVEFPDPFKNGVLHFPMGCVVSPLIDNYMFREFSVNQFGLLDSLTEAFHLFQNWQCGDEQYCALAEIHILCQ